MQKNKTLLERGVHYKHKTNTVGPSTIDCAFRQKLWFKITPEYIYSTARFLYPIIGIGQTTVLTVQLTCLPFLRLFWRWSYVSVPSIVPLYLLYIFYFLLTSYHTLSFFSSPQTQLVSPPLFTFSTLFSAIISPCVCKFHSHVIGLGFSRNSKIRDVFWNFLKQYIRIRCLYDTNVRVVSVLFCLRNIVITVSIHLKEIKIRLYVPLTVLRKISVFFSRK